MPTAVFSLLKSAVKSARSVVLGLLLCGVAATATSAEKIYIFTEKFPPYNDTFSGKDTAHNEDDITGICTDMVKAALNRLDYDYVMKMRNWSFAFNWVQGRENHALFCVTKTEERAHMFQWVGPLTSFQWTLFAAPDSDITLNSLDDAKDYVIAGYKDDAMTVHLQDRGFNVVSGTENEVNVRRLLLGQTDLWVTDGLLGPLVAERDRGVKNLKKVLVFHEMPIYLAFSLETAPAVVADFQRAIDQARDAGELAQILKRYN
jgi:polar amino acid transport system substrate-binding protein